MTPYVLGMLFAMPHSCACSDVACEDTVSNINVVLQFELAVKIADSHNTFLKKETGGNSGS